MKALFSQVRRVWLSLALCCACSLPAQVLARPGWAGSGVAPESWWHRAVFYRIDPARFQDGRGAGTGNLEGIAQRLDYLRSVGVDALVVDGSVDPNGLEDLVREASRHHLRLLLTVRPDASRDALLRTVHDWLSAGAAGIWVPKAVGTSQNQASGYPALIANLRSLLAGFPGERVLISDPVPEAGPAPEAPTRRRTRQSRAPAPVSSRDGQLFAREPLPVANADLPTLRSALAQATQSTSPETYDLMQFAGNPATGSPNAAADAAVLLASRGAALFDFGDEIGLNLYPASAADASPLPVMQWTPSNHTSAPAEKTEAAPVPGSVTEFGAYHPYRPPPRDLRGSTAPSAHVTEDANVAEALPDPDTLPGFTAGTLPVPPVDGGKLNVTTEDRDPRSLLNAYRQLIGLHQDNATLRNGTQYVLNRDAEGALVWIRRAPAGSRTVANVVVAANVSDKPVTLALDADIESLGMRPGALRPLFTFSPEPLTGETTAHLTLPPHAVLLGEIFHAGALSESSPSRSRRRVRR